MRNAIRGGPAALGKSARLGTATSRDGPELTKDQGGAAKAASCNCSWRSRATAVEGFAFVTVQHVRRACSWDAGGQQHRLSARARIVGQGSATAGTEVTATALATRMASSRRTACSDMETGSARNAGL
jgi:hypothetical protein